MNEPLQGHIVGKVTQSNDERLSVGDYVTGILPWKKINTVNGDDVTPVPSKDVPLHLYLSVLGMPGMTPIQDCFKLVTTIWRDGCRVTCIRCSRLCRRTNC